LQLINRLRTGCTAFSVPHNQLQSFIVPSDDSRTRPDFTDSRLVWQAIANCGGLVVSGLVGLVLVPAMLHDFGGVSYGLWIAMESLAAILARVDLGLNWAVTREIAVETEVGYSEHTRWFVYSSGTMSVLLGLAGFVCMASIGGPIGAVLGASRVTSSLLFAIGGAVFLLENVKTFALAVLRGTRRFEVINAVVAVAAIVWGAGALIMLAEGAGLVSLVLWQVAASAVGAVSALLAARVCAAGLRLRLGWPKVEILRRHAIFSLSSQLVTFTGAAVWEVPSFVIGVILGAPQIVPYYIGRKLPSVASGFAWRSAEVLFPAASTRDSLVDRSTTRPVLDAGTRLNLVAMIPLCIVLWVCAPELLRIWVGEASKQSVLVLRILVIVEILDAAGLASSTILWAVGAVGTVLTVDLAMLLVGVGLCVPLILWLGVTGAAVALALTIAAGSFAYLMIASEYGALGAIDLISTACDGLGLPSLACLAAASSVSWLTPAGGAASAVSVLIAGPIAFFAVLQVRGARPEEEAVLSSLESIPARFLRLLGARLSSGR
jgi:O-antigen/teichoic acid export membrane protein